MAIDPCSCDCIPANMDAMAFYQRAMYQLCNIAENTAGGGGGGDVNLTEVGGAAVALGQGLAAASIPVVIASNQSNLPTNVAQVGGAALALGQGLMAASVPVTLASNQTNLPTNVAQVGGAAIALGQGLMAASVPVTLASNQSNLPANITQVAGATIAQGHGVAATAIRVELPTDGTGVVGLVAGSATFGSIASITTSVTPGTAAANLGKAESSAHTSGDVGVMHLGYAQNTTSPITLSAATQYTPAAFSIIGSQLVDINYNMQANVALGLLKKEDDVAASADVGVVPLMVLNAVPAATAAEQDYGHLKGGLTGHLYVDPTVRATLTVTQPTIVTATSTTIANSSTTRRYLEIQNNSAANILINFDGATLTGIVPTSSNLGYVLTPGASWTSIASFCPIGNVTCYQTSGGTINTISVGQA